MGTGTKPIDQPVHFARAADSVPPASGQWSVAAIEALLNRPFMALVLAAAGVHQETFPAGDIELVSLLSIKTGGCSEDCGYCPQSAQHDTGVEAGKLLDRDTVLAAAQAARDAGARRFCMGAAWRAPKDRDVEKVADLVREGKTHQIPGMMPNLTSIPTGCAFHPRCEHVMDVCRNVTPQLLDDGKTPGLVACHLYAQAR